MNRLQNNDRAQLTVILMRLVSELAGSDERLDGRVGELINGIIELCCSSKLESLPDGGRALFYEAVNLITQKDWLLTVKKLGNSFEFEAKFGTAEMESAELANSVIWVTQAGVN
jgi:hypothetical protein